MMAQARARSGGVRTDDLPESALDRRSFRPAGGLVAARPTLPRVGLVARRSGARAPQRGFTLIEMVISASLMALVLGASYACLNAAIAGKKLIEPRADVIQNARVAMTMISDDLRAACPLSKDFEFLGMHRMIEGIQADNLDFGTHNYTPRRPREADYCQVSYFVEQESGSSNVSLYRRRNPTIAPDPLSGGSRELVASGLRGVSFEYYDGWDWYDTWGETNPEKKDRKASALAPNLSGMPEAVRVTLWFNPNPASGKRLDAEAPDNSEHPLMFETTVRLNLTAASQSGFSGNDQNGGDSAADKSAGENSE